MFFTQQTVCLSLLLATTVQAAIDLQVSEIWTGQSGSDVTEDWFEIVNLGDETYMAATDGGLWYLDDRTFDATDVVPITGIMSLAPNEVAVVVIGDAADEVAVLAEFAAEWPAVPAGTAVGYAAEGKGLGQTTDAVQLWISATAPTADDADIVSSYDHSGTTVIDAASFLPLETAFSVAGVGGATTSTSLGGDDGDTVPDESDTAAVASPGIVAGVNDAVAADDCVSGFLCVILDFFETIFGFFRNLLPF